MPSKNEIVKRTPEVPPEIQDRMAHVWDLKMRGISVRSISKALGVSVDTIYNDLRRLGKLFKEEILKLDPITLIAENLQWLQEIERLAMFELNTLRNQKQEVTGANGQKIESSVVDPNKGKFMSCALKSREMQIKLMMDTGIIGKEPEKHFKALETYSETEIELEESERTEEEIKESIEKLLKHGRRL